MDKKILITGGAGFIGSTIADLFLSSGWDVAVLDDLSSGKRENVPAGARFYPCDVRSAAATEAVIQEKPSVIDRRLPPTGQISDRFVRELASMTGRPLE